MRNGVYYSPIKDQLFHWHEPMLFYAMGSGFTKFDRVVCYARLNSLETISKFYKLKWIGAL